MPIITEPPRTCSYLPAETAALRYVFHRGFAPQELEEWIRRGWRRFGGHLFRPVCQSCAQCVSLRVKVADFLPTKNQRKVLRRNAHIQVRLSPACFSLEHVELHNRWQTAMTEAHGWPEQQLGPGEYARAYLAGNCPSLHELRYFDNDVLVGIGLIEVLPRSLSSVYFFHDPRWRPLSPGTFSVLCEIELARRMGLQHLYLGYWVAGCQSMAYKNRFAPHEVLVGRPGLEEEPVWVAGTSARES